MNEVEPLGSWRKTFDWLTKVISTALTGEKRLTPNDVVFVEVPGPEGALERTWRTKDQRITIIFMRKKEANASVVEKPAP